MSATKRPTGFKGFSIFWAGQMFSLLGTSMSNFGLTIWAFEKTGRATDLALIGFFFMTPMLIFSPLAGALVDRYDRKLMMALSDLAAGIVTIVLMILYLVGVLEIWHLYVGAAISGTFQTFQWPAVSAAISLMLPKEQYTRANSMMDLAGASSQVFAPIAAAALISFIGLGGLFAIDIVTFVIALATLLSVHIPSPVRSDEGSAGAGNLWQESLYGFRFMLKHRPLLMLQSVFMVGNFFFTLTFTLLAAMILSRTGNNELILGTVQAVGAVGGVIGGVVMSAWGGFKRNVTGVLIGMIFTMVPLIAIAFGRGEPYLATILLWSVPLFITQFFGPLTNASNQSIWMSKVPSDVQGRVFSARRLVAWLVIPLAQLIAGPLADFVMEPAMMEGGSLAPVFGPLLGTGPGAGMSLIFLFGGILGTAAMLIAAAIPQIRNVESLLPDHDAADVRERVEVAAGFPAPAVDSRGGSGDATVSSIP